MVSEKKKGFTWVDGLVIGICIAIIGMLAYPNITRTRFWHVLPWLIGMSWIWLKDWYQPILIGYAIYSGWAAIARPLRRQAVALTAIAEVLETIDLREAGKLQDWK